jgi:cytochrome b
MDRVRVWDLPVRLFHAALPILIIALFFTSEDEDLVAWHARLGLVVLALVVGRIAWGFFGSPHARFADFVPSPAGLVRYARGYLRGEPEPHLGHNPIGALMVLAMLAILLLITLTGVVTFAGPEWEGPLSPWISEPIADAVKDVHEGLAELLPWMIVAHVAGVLVSSKIERQNLPLAMVTGYKRADTAPTTDSGAWARSARLAVAALLGIGAALALATLLPGSAEAAEPGALMQVYTDEARAIDPAFAPSSARGERLYRAKHVVDGKPVSCTTCHTGDPRLAGRSPAGKVVAPLAPTANPERFRDLAKAEKWFGRNCKQVLGRPCTPSEKADFTAFALAAGGAR